MADLISQLPDELLQRILLNLFTEESVRTSVLSTRWRNVWQRVPGLHLVHHHDHIDFVDSFLNLNEESPIYQFILLCDALWYGIDDDDNDISILKCWIDKVVTCGVQLLAIDGTQYAYARVKVDLPINFYQCETLVHLSLDSVELDDFDDCQFFYLPRLETMHLDSVSVPSEVVLEMLISCSPVLRVLALFHIHVGLLKVRSQMVKSLTLRNCCCERYEGEDSGVVIDTPYLEYLHIIELENFVLEGVSSSIKMCINIECEWIYDFLQTLQNFFEGISEVTDLTISGNTLERIYPYAQQLPEFQNLTHLCACFASGFSELLPTFLSRCPNLKSLDLSFLVMQRWGNHKLACASMSFNIY